MILKRVYSSLLFEPQAHVTALREPHEPSYVTSKLNSDGQQIVRVESQLGQETPPATLGKAAAAAASRWR